MAPPISLDSLSVSVTDGKKLIHHPSSIRQVLEANAPPPWTSASNLAKSTPAAVKKPVVDVKALRPNRDPSTFKSPVTDASPHVFYVDDEPYEVPSVPMGEKRQIKIIHAGFGFSGINLSYQVKTHMTNVELVCYEKNHKATGTWLENKYPGCACDIPSHSYQFAWAPTTEWSQYYSGSDEIEAYGDKVVKDHDLGGYARLNHKIVKAEWNASTSMWDVTVERTTDGTQFVDSAHVFINGTGVLNDWKWPDIPGRESFKGEMLHSARWPKDVDLKDKRVAVIGVGSTAVQIIPSIEPLVKSLKPFIRSRTWITPSIGGKYAAPGGTNFTYTDAQKQEFKDHPELWLAYRKGIEHEVSARYRYAMKDSAEQQTMIDLCTQIMTAKLAAKPELVERLLPDFTVGCRRPTPGNGFLEALCSPKVDCVFDAIVEFTPKGIRTADGTEHEFDAIICATGFNADFKPRFPLIGRDGIDLRHQWADISESYMGIAVAGYPNLLLAMGPSSPTSHGSIPPLLELNSRYWLRMVSKMQLEPAIRSFEPKAELIRPFAVHRLKQLSKTVWTSPCNTWFKTGGPYGTLVATHPGSRSHYFQMLDNVRFEDYDWKTEGNPFSFLGSGFTLREVLGNDLVWYLDEETWNQRLSYDYAGRPRVDPLANEAKPENESKSVPT